MISALSSGAEATTQGFVLRGRELWRDPWDDYAWLRDNDPVHHVADAPDGEYWVLSRFADVFAAARGHGHLLLC